MTPKILVIGSTGKLGTSLLNFCHSNSIKIDAITCFKNSKKLFSQQKKNKINNKFVLSDEVSASNFINYIKNNKIHICYFLDYGCLSLSFLNIFIMHQSNSIIAIANKEMIVAGSKLLIEAILKSNNKFIPLDSEHFSLIKSYFNNNIIEKIYITASGGPFFYKKKISLKKVTLKSVLNHPKWEMGINNLIDSSNFINKILEIFELSSIYNIDINKVDFLVSKEAYIHSIIKYKNGQISLNCFNNNMLIPLTYPLSFFYDFTIPSKVFDFDKIFNKNNFLITNKADRRFIIFKFLNRIKKFNHKEQLSFMLLNNFAQKIFLEKKIEYFYIPFFIMKNLHIGKKYTYKLNTFSDILKYINHVQKLILKL